MDRIAGNFEIFKFAANNGDFRLGIFGMMFGVQATDDTVGGDDIEKVEIFENGSDERVVAAVFFLARAGDMAITGFEGDEFAILEIVHAGAAIAADGGERARRLDVNHFVEGASEVSAESVGTSIVVIKRRGLDHGRTSK